MRWSHISLLGACAALVSSSTVTVPTTMTTLFARDKTIEPEMPTPVPTGDFTVTELVIIDGVTNAHVTLPAKTIEIAVPTCVQTIEPDKNGHVPPGTCGAIWRYYPSFAAALTVALLFGLLMMVHVWQAAKHKKRWCWVIIMASLWETLAFAFRALSSKNQQSSGIYLANQAFILLAPLWVNAFIYMTLGRMVHYFHPSGSILRIPAATLAAIFVGLDIVSFAVQLVGGTTAGPKSPPEDQQRASHIYMAGIGLQEFFILAFVGLCIGFQRRMSAFEGRLGWFSTLRRSEWGPLLCTLYFSLLMISVRIVYRLIEFSGGMGEDNVLTTREIYFYVLEAAPMFLAVLAFNIIHPGRTMTGPMSNMPSLVATIRAKYARRNGETLLSDDSSDEREMLPRKAMT